MKLLEKVILQHLLSLNSVSVAIYTNQHAYRAGSSTDSALHVLVSIIKESVSKGEFALRVFLDICSAFDSVSHDANGRTFSPSKSEAIIFTWKRWILPLYLFRGELLPRCKYLGVTLDYKLKWGEHVRLHSNLTLGLLAQVGHVLDPSWGAGHQKITILIQMQFLNDIIKSEYGFKAAQTSYFWVFVNSKTLKFLSSLKAIFWFNDVI